MLEQDRLRYWNCKGPAVWVGLDRFRFVLLVRKHWTPVFNATKDGLCQVRFCHCVVQFALRRVHGLLFVLSQCCKFQFSIGPCIFSIIHVGCVPVSSPCVPLLKHEFSVDFHVFSCFLDVHRLGPPGSCHDRKH